MYASHQLNFFLYKRDKPFFDQVVKPYIMNKLDLFLVDWWLLGVDESTEHPAN